MKLIPRERYFRVDNSFNGLGILKSVREHWFYFVLTIPFFIAASVYLMRGADFKYIVDASFKVHREFDFPTHGAENRITGLRLHAKIANIYNYIGSVDTYSVLYEALYDLDFDVEYSRNGQSNYNEAPYRVVVNRTGRNLTNVRFAIEQIDQERVRLKATPQPVEVFDYRLNTVTDRPAMAFSVDTVLAFQEQLNIGELSLSIEPQRAFSSSEDSARYAFKLVDPSVLAHDYKQRLRVKTLNKGASILTLGITTAKKDEDADLINRMMEVYESRDLEAKNGMARNTVRFLEGQIRSIQARIDEEELDIATVKSDHNMLDLSRHAAQLMNEADRLEQRMHEQNTKLEYYRYLLNYAQKQTRLDTLLSPSLAGVNDVLLIELIQQHTALQLDREEVLFHAGPLNPHLQRLNAQVEQSRLSIVESINGLISRAELEIGGINREVALNESRIARLPALEREMLASYRKINNQFSLLKYLRKKKGQAELALASNIPDCEIWERAHVKGNQIVAPLTGLSHLMMFMVGLMIPFVIILIKGLVSAKVSNLDAVTKLSAFPLIGFTPHVRKKHRERFLNNNSPSQEREHWEMLALSLEYYARENNIIAFNAIQKNTGLSSAISHLAHAMSLNNKRVAILNLSKPNDTIHYGFVDLAQGKCAYEDLVDTHQTVAEVFMGREIDGLEEVVSSHWMGEIIRYLNHDFDYVFIDLPPRNDSKLMDKVQAFAKYWIFLFRDQYSEIDDIENTNQYAAKQGITHAATLLTDYRTMEFKWPWQTLWWRHILEKMGNWRFGIRMRLKRTVNGMG
ncbi:MAG: hypothetical protein KDC12_02440 [Flavobacteriales bacterium]|nr:hypothetical protein [Flavobacteriales bacterium]